MSQFHCTSAWVLDELEWRFRYRLPRAFDAKSVDFKFGPSIYQRSVQTRRISSKMRNQFNQYDPGCYNLIVELSAMRAYSAVQRIAMTRFWATDRK